MMTTDVVIEREAVENHVKNIQKAKDELRRIQGELDPRRLEAAHMSGAMRDALDEELGRIRKGLFDLHERCEAVIQGIHRVANKYGTVDHRFAQRVGR